MGKRKAKLRASEAASLRQRQEEIEIHFQWTTKEQEELHHVAKAVQMIERVHQRKDEDLTSLVTRFGEAWEEFTKHAGSILPPEEVQMAGGFLFSLALRRPSRRFLQRHGPLTLNEALELAWMFEVMHPGLVRGPKDGEIKSFSSTMDGPCKEETQELPGQVGVSGLADGYGGSSNEGFPMASTSPLFSYDEEFLVPCDQICSMDGGIMSEGLGHIPLSSTPSLKVDEQRPPMAFELLNCAADAGLGENVSECQDDAKSIIDVEEKLCIESDKQEADGTSQFLLPTVGEQEYQEGWFVPLETQLQHEKETKLCSKSNSIMDWEMEGRLMPLDRESTLGFRQKKEKDVVLRDGCKGFFSAKAGMEPWWFGGSPPS